MAKKVDTKWLTRVSILTAVTLILGFTPLGYIKTPIMEITFLMIPVSIGAMTLGTGAGTILGTIFGITSFIQALIAPNVLSTPLMAISPFRLFLMCLLPRILMGFLTGVIFSALKKVDKTKGNALSYIITSIASPLMNTIFFVSALLLFFGSADVIKEYMGQFPSFFAWVVAFVGTNGLIEAAVAAVVGGALSKVLSRFAFK